MGEIRETAKNSTETAMRTLCAYQQAAQKKGQTDTEVLIANLAHISRHYESKIRKYFVARFSCAKKGASRVEPWIYLNFGAPLLICIYLSRQ